MRLEIPFLLLFCPLHAACDRGRAAPSPEAFDSARAWHDLETIVGLGPRPPGSDALEKTRVLIERELSAAGLAPVRESFQVVPPAGAMGHLPTEGVAMANVYADLRSSDPKAD